MYPTKQFDNHPSPLEINKLEFEVIPLSTFVAWIWWPCYPFTCIRLKQSIKHTKFSSWMRLLVALQALRNIPKASRVKIDGRCQVTDRILCDLSWISMSIYYETRMFITCQSIELLIVVGCLAFLAYFRIFFQWFQKDDF